MLEGMILLATRTNIEAKKSSTKGAGSTEGRNLVRKAQKQKKPLLLRSRRKRFNRAVDSAMNQKADGTVKEGVVLKRVAGGSA